MIHIHHDAARRFAVRLSLTLAITPLAMAPLAMATLTMTVLPSAARAQQKTQSGQGWFVPPAQKPAATPAAPARAPAAAPAPVDQAGPGMGASAPLPPGAAPEELMPAVGSGPGQPAVPQLQVQLPPMPEIPPIPKGSPTPAAIVGILSVPDILHISTAYLQADKELAARRNKVNEDYQKEQNALRELDQTFAAERAKLTPEQIHAREKDYTDRFNESRRKFSERARIIQEAGQYVMLQIERVIEQVAQQVAASRGVNLVLNRAQVLGTTSDFDLTPQVAEVLNRILPSVVIPPDGVSPTTFKAPVAGPRVSAAPEAAPAATPAKNP